MLDRVVRFSVPDRLHIPALKVTARLTEQLTDHAGDKNSGTAA